MIRALGRRILTGILMFSAACAELLASELPWKTSQFSYAAERKPLADVLRQFFATQEIPVVISDKVLGEVNGTFDKVDPAAFLSSMTAAYGLIWFFDGDVLYIYDDSEIQSKILNAPGLDYEQFARILFDLRIDPNQPQLSLRVTEGLISVAGPPRFVKLVGDVVDGLLASDTAVPDAIEVYPLKHAWAYDTQFQANGTQVTVPGVATVLQKLLPSYASGAFGANGAQAASGVPPSIAKLTSTSVPNPYAPQGAQPPEVRRAIAISPAAPGGASVPAETSGVSQYDPLITYDVRLNAVIVRDTKGRLRSYKSVIEALDKPVQIIQIQAAIIDINVNYSLKYGNQFLFTGKAGDSRTGVSLLAPSDSSGSTSITDATSTLINAAGEAIRSSGLNVSSIIVSNAVDFIGNIQLLEQDGYANILSQPSVVTLDNLEAIIQRTQTFYVKVPGTYTTDLYNVSAGTVMKVTPHIIEKEGHTGISMIVDIQDGEIESDSDLAVENLPLTTQDNLNTRAVLREDDSLLIGGLIREERQSDDSGVPFIRKVPVVGFLFKQRTKSIVRMKRLFLITPKIITRSYQPTEDVTPLFDALQDERERIQSIPGTPRARSAGARPKPVVKAKDPVRPRPKVRRAVTGKP